MARTKLEDIGAEALRNAGTDPIANFFLRLVAPGARRELSRLESKVTRFIGGVNDTFKEMEGEDDPPPRRSKVEVKVVDAEFVDDRKKR